jgi:hypothetical protein
VVAVIAAESELADAFDSAGHRLDAIAAQAASGIRNARLPESCLEILQRSPTPEQRPELDAAAPHRAAQR